MSHAEKGGHAVVDQPGVGFTQPGYAGPPQGIHYNAQGKNICLYLLTIISGRQRMDIVLFIRKAVIC